jgi:hypothetical protein
MSPTKRGTGIDGLRRGVGQAPSLAVAPPPPPSTRTKPVRVTLNMPPELYRQVTRWADHAADQLDVPRVSVQDVLRAMAWAGVADASPESPVLAELRRERS